MAKTKKTPSRVNGRSLLKWDDKSWARNAIDVARGCGPEGVVILGAIYCIAHYGRTDVTFCCFRSWRSGRYLLTDFYAVVFWPLRRWRAAHAGVAADLMALARRTSVM